MKLKVLTNFPGGNGAILTTSHSSEGDEIKFAAESKQGEPQPLWFYFRIEGVQGPRIRCILTNASQCLGNVRGWATNAVVYRAGNGEWQRVDTVKLQDNEHLVAEAVFDIYTIGSQVEVAFCYPYQPSHLEETLSQQNVWTSGVIGYSPNRNPLVRLYNDLGDEDRSKPGIYLLARQHSGETPGSLVLDGLLRYISSEQGKRACQDICWWITPFSDIDGVINGNYGKDQLLGDLDRAWSTPFPSRPEVKAIQADMHRWMNRSQPFAIIDLPAPSYGEHGFYFHLNKAPAKLMALSNDFADRFDQAVPESLRGNVNYFYNRSGSGTSSQAGVSVLDFIIGEIGCMAATMEIAYQGPQNHQFYTIEDYRTMGRVLVDVLHEFVNEQELLTRRK